jgi:hypothetical protein
VVFLASPVRFETFGLCIDFANRHSFNFQQRLKPGSNFPSLFFKARMESPGIFYKKETPVLYIYIHQLKIPIKSDEKFKIENFPIDKFPIN